MTPRRHLARTRKDADRAIAFARRMAPKIPASAKGEVETHIARLRELAAGEDYDAIERATKDVRHVVDAYLPFWKSSLVREYAEAIVVALALALVIRSFVLQAFKIPSGSMIPTLLVGDHLIVNKFMYGFEIPFTGKKILPIRHVRRGDIVVFRFPQDPSKDFIKRVIGIPGDTVEMRDKQLWINGEKLPLRKAGTYEYDDTTEIKQSAELYIETIGDVEHPILVTDTFPSPMDNWSKTVPEGKYFCMGDNRDRSNDSRFWGFVAFHQIRGKAVVIYFSWPPSQWGRIFSLTR